MSPTRRQLLASIAAGIAAKTLPTGAALAAPDFSSRWNTVETDDFDILKSRAEQGIPEIADRAHGWLFVDDDVTGRKHNRLINISFNVDGSCRICFTATDILLDVQLPTPSGHSAIVLAPDLSQAVWSGLFAVESGELAPGAPYEITLADWTPTERAQRRDRVKRMYAAIDREEKELSA